MRHSNEEKTDVVSVILDDRELLNTFVDTLAERSERTYEDISQVIRAESIGGIQRIRCYIWKSLKDLLHKIAQKTQVLAVLAEYHAKKEVKKIKKNT
nr:hypothetical protein BHI3_10200 [Bacteriovorax sp. HI3]